MLQWLREADHFALARCPTLVFGAEHDLLFDQALLDAAARRLPGCQTALIGGAGALCAFQQPRALGEAFLRFASAA